MATYWHYPVLLLFGYPLLAGCPQQPAADLTKNSPAPLEASAIAQTPAEASQAAPLKQFTEEEQLLIERRLAFREGMAISAGPKTAVLEYYLTHGTMPDNNEQAGLGKADSFHSKAVKSVQVVGGGMIIVTFNEQIGRDNDTLILRMQQPAQNDSVVGIWDCLGGTVPALYRFDECVK